jgi:hypothetical protein
MSETILTRSLPVTIKTDDVVLWHIKPPYTVVNVPILPVPAFVNVHVIVLLPVVIKLPPAAITGDVTGWFLKVRAVISWSTKTLNPFAHMSSDAVGSPNPPFHIAELLQLPEDIAHLFGIITL